MCNRISTLLNLFLKLQYIVRVVFFVVISTFGAVYANIVFAEDAKEEVKQDDKESNEQSNNPKIAVTITGIEDQLLNNAQEFLEIYKENGKAVQNEPYILYLAKSGVKQIEESLQPFGYYKPQITMSINQDAIENGVKYWNISYQVDKGTPVKLKTVNVSLQGEGKNQQEYKELFAQYPLKKGDILEHQTYTDFKDKASAMAIHYGYFDADFTRKEIRIADNYQQADINVDYDTGKRYSFGKTTIEQDFLDQDVFERFITYKENDSYSSKAIADVQRDLYNSNYVKMIDLSAPPNKQEKKVDVTMKITPKKNKKHTFALGYGTDTGVRGKYLFDWRWVNRRGHKFKSNVSATLKTQEIGAEYRIPADKPATDYYKIFADVQRKKDGKLSSLLWNIGGAYHDQQGNLARDFGVKWQQEQFDIGNDSGNLGLLTPSVGFTYRNIDNPLNIDDGLVVKAELTGASKNLLSDINFVQVQVNGKWIKRIGDKHKIKLAGGIGTTWVEDFHKLPTAYRFFTGGDKSVRGYSFNAIGDRDNSNTNIGGKNMYYVSGEYEYFFKDSMAAAVFVDAGDAYADDKPTTHIGAGIGFHYYSPIGPIRADIAHGFNDDVGDNIRLHFNIGLEM